MHLLYRIGGNFRWTPTIFLNRHFVFIFSFANPIQIKCLHCKLLYLYCLFHRELRQLQHNRVHFAIDYGVIYFILYYSEILIFAKQFLSLTLSSLQDSNQFPHRAAINLLNSGYFLNIKNSQNLPKSSPKSNHIDCSLIHGYTGIDWSKISVFLNNFIVILLVHPYRVVLQTICHFHCLLKTCYLFLAYFIFFSI